MEVNPPCTKTVTPEGDLTATLAALPDGAVLCLAAGVYKAQLVVERKLVVRALSPEAVPGVVIEWRSAPVLVVSGERAEVTLSGITLRRGSGGGGGDGGNVSVASAARVTLRDCVLERGEAEANGGGGLLARSGEVLLERCRLVGNTGSRASAVLADGSAKVTLRECIVEGNLGGAAALGASGEAELVVERSTISDNDGRPAIDVAPRGGQPKVTVEGSTLVGGITLGRGDATVRVKGSTLSQPLPDRVEDLGGNVLKK